MAGIIKIENNNCDFQLHPAFFILSGETRGSVILSSDGLKVLASSQALSKIGEGSVKSGELLFIKTDDKQFCLLCKQDFKSKTLWTSRSHLIHCHQMFCDFDELFQHNPKWIKNTIDAWEVAEKKSKQNVPLLGKRGIEAFLVKDLTSATSQKDFRRTLVIVVARGLLPFSFINSPGNYHIFSF